MYVYMKRSFKYKNVKNGFMNPELIDKVAVKVAFKMAVYKDHQVHHELVDRI